MSTRIKGPEGGAVEGAGGSRTVARAQPAARVSGTPNQPIDGVESVHITSAAHQMLALQQQINDAPDMDAARVEQLRADINQNRYHINPARITDRLLQLEGDLQASTRKAGPGP